MQSFRPVSNRTLAVLAVSILLGGCGQNSFIHRYLFWRPSSIGSPEDPANRYLDWKKLNGIKLDHLLNMSAGFAYTDATFPWTDNVRLYYAPALRKEARKFHLEAQPGTRFKYNNYSPLIIGTSGGARRWKRTVRPFTLPGISARSFTSIPRSNSSWSVAENAGGISMRAGIR